MRAFLVDPVEGDLPVSRVKNEREQEKNHHADTLAQSSRTERAEPLSFRHAERCALNIAGTLAPPFAVPVPVICSHVGKSKGKA